NYRMNEIQAVIGIEQVKRMDEFLKKRAENYTELTKNLREIDEVSLFFEGYKRFKNSYYCHSAILHDALAPKRFEIVQFMKDHGIGTSVYYPRPVPHFTYYREKYGYTDDTFPIAARISNSSIALPVGPHLDTDDMKYIANVLKEAIHHV
ncbi:MAG TPA: DegT/DnrJ/EryC1/StrS family aminotransferase, partial [Patescibacteria group bacterium]|nr:DegT/DnrJ/EryC1/StrS family aminotransferase [Patescibacteria group bacterium]